MTPHFRFSTREEAIELLSTEDTFTQSWSQFDISSRLGKTEGTKQELLTFISQQVRTWTEEEVQSLTKIIENIKELLSNLNVKLPFPPTIPLIKTTMEEEGGAMGYTRRHYIVLNEEITHKSETYIQKLIVHELFHVLTRENTDFRKSMYQLIGFKLIDSIQFTETLKDLKITNPDAPNIDSYITVKINEKQVPCTMILYANSVYKGGRFFDYLQSGFLELTSELNVRYNNGLPVIHTLKEVSNFFAQVGRNTKYIIHPEEILADNFAYTITEKDDLQDPWLIDNIKVLITE